MRSNATRVIRLTAIAAVSACSDGPVVGCPLPLIAGLAIEARDSLSGSPVSAARALVTDGVFADTVALPGAGAWGRGGTYTIAVEAPGYRPWRRSGIRVREDRCGRPTPVHVVAGMQRGS
jgi:hypothetical protein